MGHLLALALLPITAVLRMFEVNAKEFKDSNNHIIEGNVSTCITFGKIISKLSGNNVPALGPAEPLLQ